MKQVCPRCHGVVTGTRKVGLAKAMAVHQATCPNPSKESKK